MRTSMLWQSIVLVGTMLWLPSEVHALPTPDVLVSVANIIPLLAGAVVTALGSAYFWIRKVLGSNVSDLMIGGIFGLLIVLITLLIFSVHSWNEDRRTKRIADIAMYLRCDISGHEAYHRRNQAKTSRSYRMWQQYGHFTKIPIKDVSRKLSLQPHAALIATYRHSIEYASGIPAVEVDGQLRIFDYVRPYELSAAVRHLDIKLKDLYLVDFRPFSRPPSLYKHDKNFFKRFDNVYIITDLSRTKPAMHYYVKGEDGAYRAADMQNKMIDWPVRPEKWILDEKRIDFPGIADLLPDEEVAELLEQEDVYLVAPYDSWRRSRTVHEKNYIDPLLQGINPQRIINIDMNTRHTTRNLAKIAKTLDGARFVVVGMTKYDWVYQGLDFAFEMWERLNHNTERFKLTGFSTRLPEVVAIRWDAKRTESLIDKLYTPFWQAVNWLTTHASISTGAAIIVIALLLRLAFLPISFFEARSRIIRAKIKQSLTANKRPLWSGSSPVLLHHLKVRGGWELLGTLVLLMLILPAYQILSKPPEAFLHASFLWIDNLNQPDLSMSIIIGALIYFKMRLTNTTKKWALTLLICLTFVVLLFYLPSSLLLYVVGVMIVTTCQDLLALKHAQTAISQALLKTT